MSENSEFSFEILSPNEYGLSEDDITVQFSPDFNRLIDTEIEKTLDRIWESRLMENSHLFDGSKFRLHQILPSDGSSKPVFRLGLTSYREYLGTNCCERAAEIQEKGLKQHGNAQAYMSDPLGVGTLLISSDDKFVLLRRSNICAEAQGLLDGPGGHAEPQEIPGIFSSNSAYIDPTLIAKEIFDSILREVVDEVNIPKSKLSESRLIGIVTNNRTGGRRSAEFIVRCQLTSLEIKNSFNLGTHPEAYESTAIHFFTEDELQTTASSHEFAPAMKGLLQLYFQLKNKGKLNNH